MKKRVIKVVTTNSRVNVPGHQRHIVPVNNRTVNHRSYRYNPVLPQLNPNITRSDIERLFTKYNSFDAPCLVITHLYFKDLIAETISYLKKIPYKCKFIFTLTDGSSNTPEIQQQLIDAFPECIILPMKNAGKDIGPKMKAIKWLRENHPDLKYKYLLFLHDKKHGNTKTGNAWRILLYSTLCSDKMFTSGFHLLETNTHIKMASASRWVLYGKTHGVMYGGDGGPSNQQNLRNVCSKLGLRFPQQFGFVGGTMFWCDFDHFNKFWTDERLNIAISEMDKEIGNVQEPSFTHAVERVFGMMVTSEDTGLIAKI